MLPAIIVAERRFDAFGLPNSALPLATIPVGGHSLLHHTLADLSRAGVTQVLIITSDASAVSAALQNTPPDVRVAIETSSPSALPAAVLEAAQRWGHDVLVVRADVLRSQCLAWFLSRARAMRCEAFLTMANDTAGVQLLCGGHPTGSRAAAALFERGTKLDHPTARVSHVRTAEELYLANVEAAAGRYSGVLDGLEACDRALVASGSHLAVGSIAGPGVVVGSHCHVDPSARLGLHTFLGDFAMVDRHCDLERTVVLPATFVTEGQRLSHAIVGPRAILHLDTGEVTPHDGVSLRHEVSGSAIEVKDDLLNRAIALAALLCLWPVWLAATARRWWLRSHKPVERRRFVSNRLTPRPLGAMRFEEFELSLPRASAPALSLRSWLWAAVRGHLRVVGAPPPELTTSGTKESRPVAVSGRASDVPGGVFGPAWECSMRHDLTAHDRAALVEQYAVRRTTALDLQLLVRGMGSVFSRQAWREPPSDTPRNTVTTPHRAA